jgi:hypothetical protein
METTEPALDEVSADDPADPPGDNPRPTAAREPGGSPSQSPAELPAPPDGWLQQLERLTQVLSSLPRVSAGP